jgi:hypothetical protein
VVYIQNGKGDVISVTQEKWDSLKRLGWDKTWNVIRKDSIKEEERISIEPVVKVVKKTKEVKEELEVKTEEV